MANFTTVQDVDEHAGKLLLWNLIRKHSFLVVPRVVTRFMICYVRDSVERIFSFCVSSLMGLHIIYSRIPKVSSESDEIQ